VPYAGNVYPFDYVEEAFALGIVRGLEGGLFGPDRSITRAQLTLMIVRAGSGVLVDPPVDYSDGFSDVPGFVADAVRIARYNGVLSGRNDTTFAPYGFATRGQVAKMTWNLVELLR